MKPAGTGSSTTTAGAAAGPKLVTRTVKVIGAPTAGEGGVTAFATPTSAYGGLLTTAVDESLAGLPSGSFCAVRTAMFVIGPATCTVAVSVSVTDWPTESGPIAHAPVTGS